jgi:ligand-binding sensor domain-containing protein/signal transduction histidine kinase
LKTFSKALLLTILIIAAVMPAFGQDGDMPKSTPQIYNQNIRFNHLTSEDGLSTDRVVTIMQDNQGFMWFGTFDGLNRYDGYEFKVYRHNSQDPDSLNANLITALLQDRDGYLWVGTSGGGLNRYDPRTERFTHYIHDPADTTSLGSNVVYALLQDSQGILWVGTDGGGLNRYDGNNDSFIRYQNDPDDTNSLSDNVVQSIFEDAQGTLWVGTDSGGLNRFDRQTAEFTIFRHDPEDSNSLAQDRVTAIYQDQDDELWIGTRGGLDRLDPETGYFSHFRHNPEEPNSLSHNFVSDVLEDQAGDLWVSTTGGLNRFDRQGGNFVRYLSDPDDPNSLSHDAIRSLHKDASGLLWIATVGGGVNKLDLQAKPFNQYCDTHGGSITLGNYDVHGILEDPKGVLWVGTAGGLIRVDCQEEIVSLYIADANDPQSISNNLVRAIVSDQDNNLWLGTHAGLNRFDPRNEEFTIYRSESSNPVGLLSDAVWSLHLDSQGMLWIGSALGLNQFDPKTEQFTAAYRPDPNDTHSLSGNTVTIIYEDQKEDLWIGTLGDGLNSFDRDTGRFTVFRHDPDDPKSLGDNSIYSILVDSAGRMWIGTGAGLDRFDLASGEFIHYGESQGLPSANIVGILEDDLPADQGGPNLWISTTSGLYKYNPEMSTVRQYDASDGLQGDIFNSSSVFKNRTGKLLFGGSKGLSAFYPDQIQDNTFIPPVVITNFQLANQPVEIGVDSVLEHSIAETEQLNLSYDDRVISFEFAALDYRAPAKNRYRYMLEGFDEGWSEVGADRRFVTYTNLDPGDYVFRVTGSNSDGVWNEQSTSIGITVTPPWWQTPWALGLIIALVAAGLYGAYRGRVKSFETRSQELETLVAEKTQQLDIRVKELATLLSVSQEVTSTLELEPLLSQILDELKKVVDYDVATVRRLIRGNMELKAHRWLYPQEGRPSPNLPVASIPIVRKMVQSRQAILVDDHQFDPGIVGDRELYRGNLTGEVLQASRTLMCVPLVIKDETIGMLILGHHQANFWDEEEKGLVQAFANQAAVAIVNAELYEKAGEAATLEERTRLARELHDSATQSLYSATLFSEAGKELAAAGDTDSAQHYLTRVGEVVHQALKDMRLLVFQLRPPLLEKEGLVMALQHRLDAVEKRAGIDARLISDQLPRLSDPVSEELYSITLEALNNTLKHAQTDSVRITISCDEDKVDLEVRDDGQGFDPQDAYNGGMGLTNMAERAAKLDGDLTIDSNIGQGTSIRVIVPIPEPPSESPSHTETSA